MAQLDGKIMHFMVRVADLIILHMVWLIFCLPVITAGPATTAAYVIAGRIARDEGVSVLAQFWEIFCSCFWKSLKAELVLFVWAVMLFTDCSLMYRIIELPAVLRTVVWGILIFIGLCFWIEISFVWLLIPASRGTVKELFYRAVVLAIASMGDTLRMFAENVALLAILAVSLAYVPQIAVLYGIFGAPLFFLVNAGFIRNIRERSY